MLSIVCVTKNDPNGLKSTLSSLLNINLRIKDKVEIVVVDGSETSHLDICEEFNKLGLPEIRYFNQSDRSLYDAMNIGIKEAKKNLIWFLNGGDCATNYIKDDLFYKDITNLYNNNCIGAYVCLSHKGERGKVDVSNFKIVHQGVIYPKKFHEIFGLYVDWRGFSAADYLFIRKMFLGNFDKIMFYDKSLVYMDKPGLSANIKHYICRDFIIYIENKESVFFLVIRFILTYLKFYSFGLLRKMVPAHFINVIKSKVFTE